MPCEGCNVQFTVFRRKHICSDCRRYYCSHCLTNKNANNLCERCAIFAKRPLHKIDLLHLKPKDLIFYLQSKHISTTGCVEKEELVGLVLTHVNQNDTSNMGSPKGNKFNEFGDSDKAFESIKQTCQNFFNNLTDKLATDFSFDTRASATAANHTTATASGPGSSPHISEQPRISTREIPTYFHSRNHPRTTNSPPPPPPSQPQPTSASQPKSNSSSPISPVSSPVVSLSSISSQSTETRPPYPATMADLTQSQSQDRPSVSNSSSAKNKRLETVLNDEGNTSECECSDEELITTFKDRSNRDIRNASTSPATSSPVDNQQAGPSASCSGTGVVQKNSPSIQIHSYDSSESSFEELGAIVGNSEECKTANTTQSDTWQFVNKAANDTITIEDKKSSTGEEESNGTTSAGTSSDLGLESSSGPSRMTMVFPSRPKRVTRRRSDGYLNRRRLNEDHVFAIKSREASVEEEDDEREVDDGPSHRRPSWKKERKCCGKCGKNKINIKHHLMKLRRHLESANMSEVDIKRELEEFLVYLENRTKSIDCEELVDVGSGTSPCLDENDGIHVYAHSDGDGYDPRMAQSRFLDLNDIDSLEELDNLTVKQLKEVLTLNRVDYKGCCEKQELLERVSRLWKNLKSCPAIEKLPTDELCKICMDAPIECVILECGHMATCTNCGKVLSECPICRQYIVRVVRFFRA